MKVKKILIATPLYPPQIGGPASYTRTLEEGLPPRGIEVSVVKFSDFTNQPPLIRHIAYHDAIRAAAGDVDIIYAQDPIATGLPAMYAARSLKKRFFLKVVGDRAWEEEQRKRPSMIDVVDFQTRRFGPMTMLRRSLERKVALAADKVIVPSKYLQKVVLMWGVHPERIVVIPNGFSHPSFPERNSARQAVGAYTEPYFVSIGRLSPWKGFSSVIAAMSRVRARVPNARLAIIGSGTDAEKSVLEKEIATHHLEQTVRLLGALPRESVYTHLAACDAFVLNTFYEGFSHQILEAMAAGVPIVTTAAGGNSEVLHDGSDSRIVAYNDDVAIANALLKVIEDPERAREMGMMAKKHAAAYTEDAMIDQLITVF